MLGGGEGEFLSNPKIIILLPHYYGSKEVPLDSGLAYSPLGVLCYIQWRAEVSACSRH